MEFSECELGDQRRTNRLVKAASQVLARPDGSTPRQIESWNEPCWSDAEYDKLAIEQAAQLDPQQRNDLIGRMQQIIYEQTPWVVLTYPEHLEAYNTDRWTGWTRVMNGSGPAIYSAGNIDTYLNLQPRAKTAANVSSSNLVPIVTAVGLAAVAIAVVVWIVARNRRRRDVEEV